MRKPIVFMFSGQGSQYYQMGKEMYLHDSTFRYWMQKLDEIVYSIIQRSIVDMLYTQVKNKNESFDRVLFTSPAIFMVEYSITQCLINKAIKPDYILGASLGEFVSMAISGVLSVEEVIKLVIKQAMDIENYCVNGSMLAILHDSKLYLERSDIFTNSELVSINYDSHFVISGETSRIKKIQKQLNGSGVATYKLPVSHAFHSALINEAGPSSIKYLENIVYKKPNFPIGSCLYGKIISSVHKTYLWEVILKPINFHDAFKCFEEKENCIYIDLGPSGTMANFAKNNLRENTKSEIYSIISPFGNCINNLNKVIDVIRKQSIIQEERRMNMLTFVFPGQGSQKKGMGDTLFDEFKELVEKADEILGYSIKELCLEDPNEKLSDTRYTQPAIYVVSALSYLKRIKELGKKPDFVAGHSLGEYTALFTAGAFDFETGLKLVKKRGELMSSVVGGGMASVIGLDEEKVRSILKSNNLDTIDIANYNSPYQIVISGPKEDINKSKAIFEEIKTLRMFVILNVSGAFHSRYMNGIRKEFEQLLNSISFNKLSIPVISNVYAREYEEEKIKDTLLMQINNSVKWTESICYLRGKGEMEFEEIGPGRVLRGLIRRIEREAEPLIIVDKPINNYENDKDRVIKNHIFEAICESAKTINFKLNEHSFLLTDKLKDLGMEYIEQAELMDLTLENLSWEIPRVDLYGAKDIGGLVDAIYRKKQ
ncbi:ACP S-malonyltransferase [Clostridium beijerinckii]|uniref:[acyl-carrier-protein] S-malonyltransferase n=2 Tax=Clostridium beijerinckii TaxID=1520 RepID=A0AAE5H4P7_CLOBE|nr:ACP S-malonyltransferase [Clostridium beijerinckii]AQS18313.2 ACP S-malonyltransferase [Clostridium beijerinckii NRRL B-598]NSB14151.1 malonyl CoA-acyl carrier protein transacylase [Clostridium beijerinckii]